MLAPALPVVPTRAPGADDDEAGSWRLRFRKTPGSVHGRDCRTVSWSRTSGNPTEFRVEVGRFDHEVELVVTVDLIIYARGTPGGMSWTWEKS